MSPLSHDAAPRTPISLASDWYARKRSGRMSLDEARELELWLSAPEHRAAYDAVDQVWSGAEAARTEPEILAMREAALRSREPPTRRVLAVAAALAGVAVLGGWAAVSFDLKDRLRLGAPPPEQEFRTGVGQTATVTLADGSMVTLDTDTLLRAREVKGQRLAFLDRGRAYFRVAKDPTKPFVVSAGGKTVTATGTAFDVRVDPQRFEVTLTQGRVRVEAPIGGGVYQSYVQSANMTAGSRLIATDNRHWRIVRVDPGQETAWLHGELIFKNQPLGEVAAELNRYSVKKIVIRDPKIAARPVIGSFKAGDLEEFVKAVQAYRFARVVSDTDASVELGGVR